MGGIIRGRHGQKTLANGKASANRAGQKAASYRAERAGRWVAGKKKTRQTAKKAEKKII